MPEHVYTPEQERIRAIICSYWATLTPLEQCVLGHRWGLAAYGAPQTLAQVSQLMACRREDVRRCEADTLLRLQTAPEDTYDEARTAL